MALTQSAATFLPSTTFGGGAQILDAAVGAGADEDASISMSVIFVPGFRPM